MAFIKRYSTIRKGGINFIGNTLGLSKITYTSEIKNTGYIVLFNTIFQDDIPEGTSFVSGSVFIDSINYPSYNPQTGFSLPDLAVGESVTVEFDVVVI